MLERIGSFLLAAALLAGCGTDQLENGGGTELPSPIRVYLVKSDSVIKDSSPAASARILARQWRLWSIGAQEGDSTSLLSRGVLADSAGIVTLPSDSGTYLVEAWTHSTPPDSLDIRTRVSTSSIPTSDTCMNRVSNTKVPTRIRSCGSGTSSPSRSSPADMLTLVKIAGSPPNGFRLLDTLGDTLHLGEIRIWKADSEFVFRGLVNPRSANVFDIPQMSNNETFVVEAWNKQGMAPNRIAVRSKVRKGQLLCWMGVTDPLPSTMTLHECRVSAPNLSGGSMPPDHWLQLEYLSKN